ncbi:hypothetical protein GJU39_04240 [Pedobacter petrophilus]|uniref:Outer membrane beta-barrel protein n=1 Tax=Pedobacter petrophilus TaxID=1908241 RepID=A0A7K0FVN4_9SPHI|nr:hypothetical protein [Pedobacter petrophilus]MRX75290.1 hypothetical protein [Pedobacter petrophilus]
MFRISFIITAFILSASLTLKAQNTSGIDLGPEINLPSGNFSNLSGIGLGFSVKASFPVAKDFAISISGGYANFFGKRASVLRLADLTYVPLKAGLKYYLSETFYAEGQLGAGLALKDGQKTVVIWSPGIGNQFSLNNEDKLDFGIRYESWIGQNDKLISANRTNAKGFVGIRLAYVF